MQILVVEDDGALAKVLYRGLTDAGHAVVLAGDGPGAIDVALCAEFDAIVLDVTLPGISGFDVARTLRQRKVQAPILFLTARDAPPDVVKGLDAGGDDYMTKPFAFEVLLARLRAVSRRNVPMLPPCLSVADLELDPSTRDVRRAGTSLHLTKTEYALLESLMRRAGRVVARDALIQSVWGFERDIGSGTLDTFMSVLRRKVDGGRRGPLLRTIHGVGYCLGTEPERDGPA